MREYEYNWFSKWEEQPLPKPGELVPLSQTPISPDLDIAFKIGTFHNPQHQQPPPISTPSSQPNSGEQDSSEPARTVKRSRLVWTPQLHKRFVDAVNYFMSIDGLTCENVASHLQKYKRMQGNGGVNMIRESANEKKALTLFPPGDV